MASRYSLFRNSVFDDPVEWSRRAVGTRLKFAFVVGTTLSMGLLTMAMARVTARWISDQERWISRAEDAGLYDKVFWLALLAPEVWFYFLVAITAIFVPSVYLIGLRGVVRELDGRIREDRNENEVMS